MHFSLQPSSVSCSMSPIWCSRSGGNKIRGFTATSQKFASFPIITSRTSVLIFNNVMKIDAFIQNLQNLNLSEWMLKYLGPLVWWCWGGMWSEKWRARSRWGAELVPLSWCHSKYYNYISYTNPDNVQCGQSDIGGTLDTMIYRNVKGRVP